MSSLPVAILGATGYAGEGALRILLQHPHVDIVHVGSDRLAGTKIGDAIPPLAGRCDLVLAPDTVDAIRASGAKCIILAKKSPDVTRLVPDLIKEGLRIIDIGAEFRLRNYDDYKIWYGDDHECPDLLPNAIYGLSEVHKNAIKDAAIVGNPGCYPTSILLPLIPLLAEKLINVSAPLTAVSFSGVSGAGKTHVSANNNLYYSINENIRPYGTFKHKHTAEINQELSDGAGESLHLHFAPHLAPITRGILSSITFSVADNVSTEDIYSCWEKAYADKAFIRLRKNSQEVEISNVTMSNYCDFAVTVDGSAGIIHSAIDNLVKGASGQAVQNLNIMYGFPETAGLLDLGI